MSRKRVLLIGASGDIGLAIGEELLRKDYELILHYHLNKAAVAQLAEHKNIVAVYQANLADMTSIKKFLAELDFRVDAVVFASGKAHFGLFQDTQAETLENMLTLHVKAPWLITQHILPNMIKQKDGRIIFISSIWGTVGASYEVLYSTVKGAQNSMAKALAKEVAPSGISVNAISPGFIDTKMNDFLTESEKQDIIADIPMNRAGTVEEVAHAVSFLMDEKAKYIQGEIIHITGGW